MGCNITLKLDNKKEITFDSDAGLDQLLMNEAAALEAMLLGKDKNKWEKIFALSDEEQAALTKVNEIVNTYKQAPKDIVIGTKFNNDLEEYETVREKVKGAMGVTSVVETIGNDKDIYKPMVTGTNADYEKYFKEKINADLIKQGINDPVARLKLTEEAWQKEVRKGELSADLGTDIHYILETMFKQLEDPSIDVDINKLNIMKEADYIRFKTVLKDKVDKIVARHGKDAKYMTEVPILSKHLPDSVRTALRAQGYGGIEAIEGRIDLLVIDPDGKAYVYDWKTSAKRVGDWDQMDNEALGKNNLWKSAKKVKAFGQQGFYGAILEQYGLEIGDLNLVPLYMEYKISDDGKRIESIDNLEWDIPVGEVTAKTLKKMRTAEYLFGVTKPISIENLKKVGDILTKILPGTMIGEQQVKHYEATASKFLEEGADFVRSYSEGDEAYDKGYRYFFYKSGLPDRRKIQCKDWNEVKEKIEEYVKELNEYMGTQMWEFNKSLMNVLHTKGESKKIVSEWLATFSQRSQDFLQNEFRKYIQNGWQLTVNQELANQGIFIFKKGEQLDIVCMTEHDINEIIEVIHESGKKTHTVLGHKLLDTNQGADPLGKGMDGSLTGALLSSYGNLLQMKIAAILSTNPEIVNEAKINTVKVINPWHRTENEVQSNEQFYYNWNRLVQLHPELNLHTLGPQQFYKDIDVCIHNAAELMLSEDLTFASGLITPETGQKAFDEAAIRRMLKQLKQRYGNSYNNPKTKEGYAYLQLQKALLCISGIHAYYEPDRGKYMNSGMFPTGTYIYNADISMSINGRVLGYMMGGFRDLYTTLFNAEANPFTKICNEVYKEWNVREQLINPRIFWQKFFEQDEDGNVRKEMRIKKPTHPDFKDKPFSRKFIEYFTDTLAKHKYKNLSEEQVARLKESGDYYNVPLVPAQLGQYVRDTIKRDGAKGLASAIWQSIKDVGEEAYNYYSGKREWQEKWEETTNEDDIVYNRYLDIDEEQRNELIYGTKDKASHRVWDTDLRAIFLHSISAAAISDASISWGPKFAALLAVINYNHLIGGANMKEIAEYIEKYVDNKVFLKDIRDPSLSGLKNLLNSIKKVSSMMTLGFSTRNFTKEMLTQMYMSATRSSTKQMPDINSDDFWFGFQVAIRYAPTSIQIQNFMMFLNQRYGLSSYGGSEMADTLRRTRFGLRNMNTGDVFIGTRIPDDIYRLAILMAKMHHDGCYDAYIEDNDTWRYDISRDKRFERYLNDDMSDPQLYAEQKALHESYRREWLKQAQSNHAYDDWDFTKEKCTFPDAYPPDVKAAIRAEANNLFGAFDREDKSLLTATFLGSAFMQYKTWLSAKLNQWMRSPGFVNIWQRHWQVDDKGRKLYVIYSSEDELNQGLDPVRYINEDDPDLQNLLATGRCVPYIIEEGTFQEGMLQATGALLKDIITWDMDEFRRHWEDPVTRGQFINGLSDALGLLLFAGLVQLMFGEDVVSNMKEQAWVTQWSYGVLMGFAQDGPLHQVLGSTVSDLNPPALLAVKQWAQTANNVLAGSKSLGQGLVESFGMSRELRGYFYTLT